MTTLGVGLLSDHYHHRTHWYYSRSLAFIVSVALPYVLNLELF